MRRFRYHLALLMLSVLPGHAIAQDQGQGLKFSSPEALAGIPLASTPFSGSDLPTRVDLSDQLPPPGNQGAQNSCVGWAVAYAMKSYQERVEERWHLVDGDGAAVHDRVFSPAFIYNQINQGQDGGAVFVDALNLLSSQGAALWSGMPYDPSDYLTQPSDQNRAQAKRFRIDYWRRVNAQDPNEVKAQLAAGYPVVIGAIVDDGFKSLSHGDIWRDVTGTQRGGHAMLVVGYDDTRAAFQLLNSWGTSWGDNGIGWLSYDLFPRVVREAFVSKDAANGAAPSPGPNVGPTAPVDVATAVNFQVAGMQHNVAIPGVGLGMQVHGTVNIPPGVDGSAQVVIQFFANDGRGGKGIPVGSLMPQFATVQGQAATGTPQTPIGAGGLNTTWSVVMPYYAMNIPKGLQLTAMGPLGTPIVSYLVAEPTLYVNNFGVRTFPLIPFYVNL